MSAVATRLVFSDLDGSLLDHHSYSYKEALPQVTALEREGVPLILVSSKTRAEMLALREELANRHPFIVENGAAVFIPLQYFAQQPAETTQRDGFWVWEMAPPRTHWLAALQALKQDFPDDFESFAEAGVDGIVAMTGLSRAAAERASQREYSEPVRWLAGTDEESRFIECLAAKGATVTRGGRFLSVAGPADKGTALQWLRACYRQAAGGPVSDLAIGDGPNDRPMLETAQTALLIRSPVHDFPQLDREEHVIRSQGLGPVGWAEGVSQWLSATNHRE